MSAPTQPYPPAPNAQQPASIATASVVLGAVGFVVGVCAPVGLVLGLLALGKAKRREISPARVTAGIVVSVISTALQGLFLILVIAALAGGESATTATPKVSATTTSEAPVEPSGESAVVEAAPVESEAIAPPPAPAEETQAAPADLQAVPSAAGIGQEVIADDVAYTVTSFNCGVTSVGSEYFSHTAQGEFCEAIVSIRNEGTSATTFNSSDANAYIGEIEYAADGEASIYAEDGNAFLTDINPGNTVTAKLYFDVPVGARPDRVEIGAGWFAEGAIINVA